MKILVTGGCGFIGSNFIRFILGKYPDCGIINLDKLTYCGNPDNLRDIAGNPKYSFVKGDICNKKTVERAIKDCNAVVNFAAETHVDRSIIDAGAFVKTDVFGTYTLLEAARKFNVDRYVQISTDEVYGSKENGSFKEDDKLEPNSPYSASKAGADMVVRSYCVTYGLPAIITRSSNNFGPYQYPEKLIPLFITNAIRDRKLPLYGDGLNVRDWLYVIDNCSAIDLIMRNGKTGEIYNIGGRNEKTNLEITNTILGELKKPKELINFVKDRPGHDRRYSLDCSRIKQLGWKPRYDFESAIKETIVWYTRNEWWWEPLIKGQSH